jgi:hypothetical protein
MAIWAVGAAKPSRPLNAPATTAALIALDFRKLLLEVFILVHLLRP